MNLKGLSHHVGTVEHSGKRIAIHYAENQKIKTCFLNATTQFAGPINDRLAMKSLRDGLHVNVWLNKESNIALYASPNWR